MHVFVEYNVYLMLESDMAHAFHTDSNKGMTSTDTQKNTVYYVAKKVGGHPRKYRGGLHPTMPLLPTLTPTTPCPALPCPALPCLLHAAAAAVRSSRPPSRPKSLASR